jgi:hypothetical protein
MGKTDEEGQCGLDITARHVFVERCLTMNEGAFLEYLAEAIAMVAAQRRDRHRVEVAKRKAGR